MIACFFAKQKKNKQKTKKKSATLPPFRLRTERTVTADWYFNHCLPKIFQALCKRRPRTGVRGLLLHHDNASADTAAVTLDFVAANDVHLVTHPTYSPDLAPCDWFLFPSVKRQLKVKTVSERQRCPSIHRGRHFGLTQVNVVGCHRQLV